jgi:hypothetical protein
MCGRPLRCKEIFARSRPGRVQSWGRPVCAVHLTAGHDVIRERSQSLRRPRPAVAAVGFCVRGAGRPRNLCCSWSWGIRRRSPPVCGRCRHGPGWPRRYGRAPPTRVPSERRRTLPSPPGTMAAWRRSQASGFAATGAGRSLRPPRHPHGPGKPPSARSNPIMLMHQYH